MKVESPTPRKLTASEDWRSYLWYETVFWASMTSFTLGWSLRTEGVGNVPRQGPVLLIANHQSFLDPALVGLAARRHLCYLARLTLFHFPPLAWLIRSLNAVPIDQEGLGIGGLRVILQLLREGQAVLVFPEGSRTPNGAIHPLEPGVQLLIKRAQAPIVPIGIAGAFEAWPKDQLLPRPAPLFLPADRGTLAVSVGPPLEAARFVDLPREHLLTQLREQLQHYHERAEHLRRQPED